MDEQEANSELIIFLEDQGEERQTVRKVWHNGRFYFSVLDIIAALQVSQQPRTYGQAPDPEPEELPEDNAKSRSAYSPWGTARIPSSASHFRC